MYSGTMTGTFLHDRRDCAAPRRCTPAPPKACGGYGAAGHPCGGSRGDVEDRAAQRRHAVGDGLLGMGEVQTMTNTSASTPLSSGSSPAGPRFKLGRPHTVKGWIATITGGLLSLCVLCFCGSVIVALPGASARQTATAAARIVASATLPPAGNRPQATEPAPFTPAPTIRVIEESPTPRPPTSTQPSEPTKASTKTPAVAATQPAAASTSKPPTVTPQPPTATPQPLTNTPRPPTATPRPPTATPRPPTNTPRPPTPTRPPATDTPVPQPTAPPPPPVATGVNGNPWGYNFDCCNFIYSPPTNFCSYFSCISSFWNGNGYVMQCQDGTFSKSGGIQGSCSRHGGNQRALLAP
jgi:hypothetical protein